MSIRDFISSILDHKRIFAFLIALSVVLCSIGLKLTESHTAEIIIKYICDSAEEGLTENGQKINPYEINSSLVVKNAVSALGLKNTNIEGICRNITITPIIPTSEQEKYASWIEKFSDYEKNEDEKKSTVYYSVKYTSPVGKDYAKRMLSAVISQYRLFYVGKYTYSNDITQLSGETVMQYDYYDTVDMLREKIKSNIDYLSRISSADNDYRSPHTGYSLLDLAAEYKSLSEQDLSVAERMIVENGIKGFDEHDTDLIACIARYHRGGLPDKEKHEIYSDLDKKDRKIVKRLGGILRIADGFDRAHLALIRKIKLNYDEDSNIVEFIVTPNTPDYYPDITSAIRKRDLFEIGFKTQSVIKFERP